jgi:hypothetical protein
MTALASASSPGKRLNHEGHDEHGEEQDAFALLRVLREAFVFFV